MRKISQATLRVSTIGATLALSLMFAAQSTFAAPFNATNNPQILALYLTGDHGIVGENETHTGADVVMQAGNSGNFQQWFYGTSTEGTGNTEGDHSVWKSVGSDTTCQQGDLVINANQTMGSYLVDGNYCVSTNDFNEHPDSGN